MIFVAEQGGQWVGSATGLTPDPGGSDRPGLLLVAMFVDGTVRWRGVALVESIVDWARARDAARLTLWRAISAPLHSTGEVVGRLKKDWVSDIKSYDEGHAHMLMFADVLSDGTVKQYPEKLKR